MHTVTGINKSYCIVFFLIMIINSALAQVDYYQSFEKKLTPSPAVSTLGTYGGITVGKNTGAIQKSISLFQVQQGPLIYSPSIDYYSTGIRVDDWGSRVGIGWNDKLTATITRTVKGVADEAGTHISSDAYTALDGFNSTQYNLIKSMTVPNTTVDGQFDVYSFDLFGKSGSFIIRSSGPVLLKDDKTIHIEITQTSPILHFILTDTENGNKYHFEQEVEKTSFNHDNACDVDNPYNGSLIPTVWYLNKMASPGGNEITFDYESAGTSYIYDFNDYWTYAYFQTIIPWWCPDAPMSGYRTNCLRAKSASAKLISQIHGENFTVIFDYIDRNDIYGEKLIKEIALYNNNTRLKVIKFEYDEYVATSTFETELDNNLEDDWWLENSIRERYFLRELKLCNSYGNAEEIYKFGYIDPSLLPHRFTFAKDYMGIYNGAANAGLVLQSALDSIDVDWDKSTVTLPYCTREPDMVGTAGLLNRITYPTGGKDSVVYEQNEFKFKKPDNTVIDSVFACYRIKKIIGIANGMPDVVRHYNYNVFSKVNDKLVYADSSSLIRAAFLTQSTIGAHVCSGQGGGGPMTPYSSQGGLTDYPMYTLRDRPNFAPEIYGGLPYAYQYVTEFQNDAKTSFVASEFRVSKNKYAERIAIGYYHPEMGLVSPEIDNWAWDNGLELRRYTGSKSGTDYLIDQQTNWAYSNSYDEYFNFSASPAFQSYSISTDMELNIGHYLVRRYPTYSHWTKLDTITTVNFSRHSGSYFALSNQVIYRYNSTDRQVEEEETTNSLGETMLKISRRPTKMVSLSLDPSGVYAAMISIHLILPEVEVISKRAGTQTSLVRTNYHQPFTGLFVPQNIETQTTSSSAAVKRVKYLQYDIKGNVLSISKDGGTPTCILWSYNGQYPVIKVEGVSYSAIVTELGSTVVNNLWGGMPDSSFGSYVAQLKTAFPDAQVSWYRYDPHVGVRVMTDPKDLSTYFMYDQFQRLESVYDHNGHITKSYEYHTGQ